MEQPLDTNDGWTDLALDDRATLSRDRVALALRYAMHLAGRARRGADIGRATLSSVVHLVGARAALLARTDTAAIAEAARAAPTRGAGHVDPELAAGDNSDASTARAPAARALAADTVARGADDANRPDDHDVLAGARATAAGVVSSQGVSTDSSVAYRGSAGAAFRRPRRSMRKILADAARRTAEDADSVRAARTGVEGDEATIFGWRIQAARPDSAMPAAAPLDLRPVVAPALARLTRRLLRESKCVIGDVAGVESPDDERLLRIGEDVFISLIRREPGDARDVADRTMPRRKTSDQRDHRAEPHAEACAVPAGETRLATDSPVESGDHRTAASTHAAHADAAHAATADAVRTDREAGDTTVDGSSAGETPDDASVGDALSASMSSRSADRPRALAGHLSQLAVDSAALRAASDPGAKLDPGAPPERASSAGAWLADSPRAAKTGVDSSRHPAGGADIEGEGRAADAAADAAAARHVVWSLLAVRCASDDAGSLVLLQAFHRAAVDTGLLADDRPDALAPLSRGERETVQLLLTGKSEAVIATLLRRSPHTVHSHVKRAYRKLGVASRAELMAKLLPV